MSFLYKPSIWSKLLTPISWLLALLVVLRKGLYQASIFKTTDSSLPVIVVGNITVGGTGKSPLVSYLVKQLLARGLKPGIVSRGYGGMASKYPLLITSDISASQAGDEAKMLADSCHVPVVVSPDRADAVRYLADQTQCDVVISDDGLQHYAMARNIELVLIDESRALGNGLLLPLGPLREPASRLQSVSAVIRNFRFREPTLPPQISVVPEFRATFQATNFVSLANKSHRLGISEFRDMLVQSSQPAFAVAGIGNPDSFFNFLTANNIAHQAQAFSDHHDFRLEDFAPAEDFILMTEKDAIKCQQLSLHNAWYLEIEMQVQPNLADFCLELLAIEER